MKKEFYGSREQCMRPIGKGRNALKKKKKKKKTQMQMQML